MKLSPRFETKQTIKISQTLSPRTIQLLKTFQLPYSDLVDVVKKEAEDNVFLEVSRFDDMSFSSAGSRTTNAEGLDIDAIAANESASLPSFLMDQLALENLKDKEEAIAHDLIDAIDARGYITTYPQLKVSLSKSHQVSERKISDVLKIIQTFEPEGVGARSLKECLLIQIEAMQFEHDALKDILKQSIQHHLDIVSKANPASLAAKLSISTDGAEAVIQYIQGLNPEPGARFQSTEPSQYVTPSLKFELDEYEQVIVTNYEQSRGVRIQLSPAYEQTMADPTLDKASKQFLKQKYENAKAYVDMLENRQKNLESLGKKLASFQINFLKYGQHALKPLTQTLVATELGISPSTISRILNEKFVETPFGIFPLKAMCPRGHSGYTAIQLQKLITDILGKNPRLTDQAIETKLHKMGISIARRTIAKYRKLAGLSGVFHRDK